MDIVPNDDRGYRVAFIEAFRRRGIYPQDVRNLSSESLCWPASYGEDKGNFEQIAKKMSYTLDRARLFKNREETFKVMADWRKSLRDFIRTSLADQLAFERLTGLEMHLNPQIPDLEFDKKGFLIRGSLPASGPAGRTGWRPAEPAHYRHHPETQRPDRSRSA